MVLYLAEINMGLYAYLLVMFSALIIPSIFCLRRKNKYRQEMLSTESAVGVRDTLDSQKFSLPELFPQKADAVKYLEAEQLWAVHPGLWVTSIVEPKLAVSGAVCLPVCGLWSKSTLLFFWFITFNQRSHTHHFCRLA